jgi:methionine synthase II (cobalamin-independent)
LDIVPTEDEVISKESVANLMEKLEGNFNHNHLAEKGISYDDLLENSLITPACGLGTRSEAVAIKAFELTKELSGRMREKYKLL